MALTNGVTSMNPEIHEEILMAFQRSGLQKEFLTVFTIGFAAGGRYMADQVKSKLAADAALAKAVAHE